MSVLRGILTAMTGLWLLIGLVIGLASGLIIGKRQAPPADMSTATDLAGAQGRLERADSEIGALKQHIAQLQENQQVGQRLDDLLTPMRNQLRDLGEQSNKAAVERAAADTQLAERMQQLKEGTDTLNATTTSISAVLTNSQIRGRFGEMQLETMFEYAGLIEGIGYSTQLTTTDDDGSKRPDFTLNLPGGGRIILDSKFPLTEFMAAQSASDDASRQSHLNAHAKAVVEHCKALAKRGYTKDADSVEFVITFLPVDALLTAALDANPSLLDEIYKLKVGVATPVTLMPLLMTLQYTWQKHEFAKNALQIQQTGVTLHDRLVVFGGHLAKVGSGLKSALTAFNNAVGSYDGRVIPAARAMRANGLPAAGELDDVDPVTETVRDIQTPYIVELPSPSDSEPSETG